MIIRGLGATPPILTGGYWQQGWLGIPFWAWAIAAFALGQIAPSIKEAARRSR